MISVDTVVLVVARVLLPLVAACGTTASVVGTESNSADGAADAMTAVDAATDSGRLSVGPDGRSADAAGNSAVEVCDGLDNDGNGIIDDVDLGNDGICDCLSIATLGAATYSDRNATFEDWLKARSSAGLVALASTEITPMSIAPFQVIIVQDVRARAYSASEVAALAAWVEAGGGLLTLTGYVADANVNINGLLAPFGVTYGTSLVMISIGNVTLPVTHWSAHPVSLGISQVGVQGAYEVKGGGTVVAEADDVLAGRLAMLRAVEHGAGKVLSWGDEWVTFDSEWSAHPDYQVARFWQNALKWLTPATECQVPIALR